MQQSTGTHLPEGDQIEAIVKLSC